jgi:3D-(3,5/4)-trihydroxycyclohexane-1,2-dione acylhydrolase (decyclizing)
MLMDEQGVRSRARVISTAGGLARALRDGKLDPRIDVTVSEGGVPGLLKQGARKFFGILEHGNTDIGEILRIYAEEGVLLQRRNATARAATASRTYGWRSRTLIR